MVYIHGGGFILGNPDLAGGTALPMLKKDVVLVSMQYRLGTLGETVLLFHYISYSTMYEPRQGLL